MGLPQGFPRPSCSTCGPAASQLEHSACISIIRAHEKRTQVRTHRSSEHEHGVLGIRVAKLIQYSAMPRCPVGEARSVEVAPHACQLSRWRVGRTTVHRGERITLDCDVPRYTRYSWTAAQVLRYTVLCSRRTERAPRCGPPVVLGILQLYRASSIVQIAKRGPRGCFKYS